MDGLINGLKNFGRGVKNAALKVRNIFKFFGTVLGHIVFVLALGIICIILIYILGMTITRSLQRIFGIESAGIKNTNDYAVLQQLTNSGYNTLMDSEKLAEYLNFEYAVTMDAARFFSETGVYEKEPEKDVDVDIWDPSFTDDDWARLATYLINRDVDSQGYKDLVKELAAKKEARAEQTRKEELVAKINKDIQATSKEIDVLNEAQNTAASALDTYERAYGAYDEKNTLKNTQADYDKAKKAYEANSSDPALKAEYERTGRIYKAAQEVEKTKNTYDDKLKSMYNKYYKENTSVDQLVSDMRSSGNSEASQDITSVQNSWNAYQTEYAKNPNSAKTKELKRAYEKDLATYSAKYRTAASVMGGARRAISAKQEDVKLLNNSFGILQVKLDEARTDTERAEAWKVYSKIYNELNYKYIESSLTNTHSSIDLFYKVSENGTMDNQQSLVPYLRIFRDARTNIYYLQTPSMWEKDTNGKPIYRDADGKPAKAKSDVVEMGQRVKNEGEEISNPFIREALGLDNIPYSGGYYINTDLNGRNKDLWLHSSEPGLSDYLTVIRDYPHDDLFFEVRDAGSATYEIPFRVLIERFLPKAQLLSSWYMLKDSTDGGKVDQLLEEIKGIYNRACMSGEELITEDKSISLVNRFASMMGIEISDKKYYIPKAVFKNLERKASKDADGTSGTDPATSTTAEYYVDLEKLEKEDIYTNLMSFVIFQRIYFEFYSGGNWDIAPTEIFTAVTDLVDAAQISGEFSVGIGGSLYLTRVDDDGNIVYEYINVDKVAEEILEEILEGKLSLEMEDIEEAVIVKGLSGSGVITDRESAEQTEIPALEHPQEMQESVAGWYHIVKEGVSEGGKLAIDSASLQAAIEDRIAEAIKVRYSSQNYVVKVNNDDVGTPMRNKGVKVEFKKGGVGEPHPVFTTEEVRFGVTIQVSIKKMPAYFPAKATTWSREILFTNDVTVGNDFKETNLKSLLPMAVFSFGFKTLDISTESAWRTELYAPHFTATREKDVIAMIAEWEKAADNGTYAADTYIRDLYQLIQYSKPEYAAAAGFESTVDENNYIYINVPDEILYYDETTTDYAFWLEHLLASTADPIEPEENLKMRSRMEIMKWQQVDYSLYPECEYEYTDSNGNKAKKYKVYALWPEGGYISKSYYAISANASEATNLMIESWGGWKWNGRHAGVDLYGRHTTDTILRAMASTLQVNDNGVLSVAGEVQLPNGYAAIPDDNNLDPSVPPTGANGNEPSGYGAGGGVASAAATNVTGAELNFYAKTTGGSKVFSGLSTLSLYRHSAVTLELGGTKYTFPGTASAIYGYELYRLAKATGNGEEASNTLVRTLLDQTKDMPVVSVAPGIVSKVIAGPICGFKVEVTHTRTSGEVYTNYVHLKRYPLVQEGEYIGAGTILGYEGTTGGSGGVHLHFEIAAPSTEGGKTVKGTYPIPYLYPFFTPFYKAPDEGQKYPDGDEHLSLVRTVYPVGQIVPIGAMTLSVGEDGQLSSRGTHYRPERAGTIFKQVKVENIKGSGNNRYGTLKVDNYVPSKALLDDYNDLPTQYDEKLSENFLIKPEDLMITGGVGTGYTPVTAYEIYFDPVFLEIVKAYGGYLYTGDVKTGQYVFDNDKPKMGDDGFNYGVGQWKQLEMELDERVIKAGYGSRAGVAAAARFLAGMERSIPYLGQKAGNIVSDVGIYARRGLNTTWGQRVICAGSVYEHNGFDCTGFANWCLINGGVKPEGYNGGDKYGKKYATMDAINKGLIQEGDIICTLGAGGEFHHIGIVIGQDANYVYVAEEAGRLRINTIDKKTGICSAGSNKRGLNYVYIDENHTLYPSDGNMDIPEVRGARWVDQNGNYVATF